MNTRWIIAAVAVALLIGAGVAALVLTGVWPGPSAAERERARTLYVQAQTQLEGGDHDAALASLDQSIALDPQNEALRARSSLYIGRGNFDGALRDLDKVISRGGGLAANYSTRCWLRARGDKLDGARADCDRALEIDSSMASAFGNRGLVGLRQGRHQEAWSDFNTAMRVGGSDEWVSWRLFGRGVAAWGRGDTVAGREDIEQALQAKSSVAAEFADFGIGREIVREFEDSAYAHVLERPSLMRLAQFLAVYPEGARAAEARAKVSEINARVEAEEAAGRQAIPGFSLAQARGPGAADSFGAIGISQSSWRVAFSTDYAHPQEAMIAAQRACGRDCDAYAFRNVCAALVLSRPDRIRGMAWDYERDAALDTAIADCRMRGGRACVAVHSQCTPTREPETAR